MSGALLEEADDTFGETMLFCHGFKNDKRCLHSLPTSIQYKMEEK